MRSSTRASTVVAVGLLVVDRVVLGVGDDRVVLDALDDRDGGARGQERILAEVLEVAAVERRAGDVHARAPSITLMPLLWASAPMVRPNRRCRSGFQVAACATPEGNVVVAIWRPATPEPASLSDQVGDAELGLAGHVPRGAVVSEVRRVAEGEHVQLLALVHRGHQGISTGGR